QGARHDRGPRAERGRARTRPAVRRRGADRDARVPRVRPSRGGPRVRRRAARARGGQAHRSRALRALDRARAHAVHRRARLPRAAGRALRCADRRPGTLPGHVRAAPGTAGAAVGMSAPLGGEGAPLEFWFEFASTYSYPAAMRVEEAARAAGVPLAWRPFLLGPIFGAQGWNDSPFNVYPVK